MSPMEIVHITKNEQAMVAFCDCILLFNITINVIDLKLIVIK